MVLDYSQLSVLNRNVGGSEWVKRDEKLKQELRAKYSLPIIRP